MAYVGGKSKGARFVAPLLNHPYFDGKHYIEPFVGYAHILKNVSNKSSYTAFDVNENVIAIHKFIQSGRTDFPVITKEDYQALRDGTYISRSDSRYDLATLKGFAAFTYSYAGKEWGGFTVSDRGETRNYIEERWRYYLSLQNSTAYMNAIIERQNYETITPPCGALLYCDPPYRPLFSEQAYYGLGFDHDAFWGKVREWVIERNCIVLVSEYSAPKDFLAIKSWGTISTINQKTKKRLRVEQIYVHQSQFNTLWLLNYNMHASIPYVSPEVLMTKSFNEMLEILDVSRNVTLIKQYFNVITSYTYYRSAVFDAFEDADKPEFRAEPLYPFHMDSTQSQLQPMDPYLRLLLSKEVVYPNLKRHLALLAWTLATGVMDRELYEVGFETANDPYKAVLLERLLQPNRRWMPFYEFLREVDFYDVLVEQLETQQLSWLLGKTGDDGSDYVPVSIGLLSTKVPYAPVFYDPYKGMQLRQQLIAKKDWKEYTEEDDDNSPDEIMTTKIHEMHPQLLENASPWMSLRNNPLAELLAYEGDYDADVPLIQLEFVAAFEAIDGQITANEKEHLVSKSRVYDVGEEIVTNLATLPAKSSRKRQRSQ